MDPKLRPKQQRFVSEFLVDCNATQAAIRAGYSKATAYSIGNENLKKPEIAAAIRAAREEMQARTEITADRVVRELAKIAFVDPRRFFRTDGSLVPVHELDDDTAAGLAGLEIVVSVGDDGEVTKTARIKIADKRAALVDLGRHLGLFDRRDRLGTETNPLRMLIDSVQGTALPVVEDPPPDDDEDDYAAAA